MLTSYLHGIMTLRPLYSICSTRITTVCTLSLIPRCSFILQNTLTYTYHLFKSTLLLPDFTANAKLKSVLKLQCYQLQILQQKKDRVRTTVHKEHVQNEQVGKQWKGWITLKHDERFGAGLMEVSRRNNMSEGAWWTETCN
jgi:hypothetical protein